MKKSFKGFLACLLALIMVIPMFTVANADQMSTFNGTLQARETASVDVSRIRNSGIDMTADVAVKEQRNPEDIVTILVELEAAPAAEVCEDLKAAGDYREQLNASHKTAAAMINEKLGTEIVIKHNYSVVFNGFAFEGEYRLIDEINKLDGVRAFVDMEWESPNLFNTTTQVGAVDAWALDYSGEGTVVAILDTGCKVDHPAFSVEPSNVKFTRDNIASIIASGELQGSGSQMNVNSVYVSGKIPFRWNYYGNNADVSHKSSDHGTHVAGIAAGNGGEIQGVAKDAQLAAMQVFAPTGGASWSTIILAVEDCAVLGVDSANLSLGSPCGQESYYDASYAEVFERVTALGVNFAMAAGNDYDASMNNAWGSSDITTGTWGNDGYNLVSNPDYGVVGSPSTWPASLSVASVRTARPRVTTSALKALTTATPKTQTTPLRCVRLSADRPLNTLWFPASAPLKISHRSTYRARSLSYSAAKSTSPTRLQTQKLPVRLPVLFTTTRTTQLTWLLTKAAISPMSSSAKKQVKLLRQHPISTHLSAAKWAFPILSAATCLPTSPAAV